MYISRSTVIAQTEAALKNRADEIEQTLKSFARSNQNLVLQVMFDPRWKTDLDMLAEHMVLEYFNDISNKLSCFHEVPYGAGRFSLSSDVSYWADDGWFGDLHQIARYGYLDSDVLLHHYSHLREKCWPYGAVTGGIEPSLDQWSYWTRAQWVNELTGASLTPRTWFDKGYATVPDCEHGWVVKGTVRSIRQDWNNRMYADDRERLRSVMNRLLDDSFVSKHGLMIREFMPLMQLRDLVPDSETPDAIAEYRLHINQGKVIQKFDYWNPDLDSGTLDQEIVDFALRCYALVEYEGWVVVDVARLATGELICIEFNCGPTSGIADPIDFWLSFLKNYQHKDEDAVLDACKTV